TPALTCFVFMLPRPPPSTLFPYTTLFRSRPPWVHRFDRAGGVADQLEINAVAHRDRCLMLVLLHACQHLAGIFAALGQHDEGLRSEEHTSELQSRENLVCRLLLEKKNIPR